MESSSKNWVIEVKTKNDDERKTYKLENYSKDLQISELNKDCKVGKGKDKQERVFDFTISIDKKTNKFDAALLYDGFQEAQ